MSQQELLARVISVLNAQGVPYMITGSFASSLQGAPRATHDIDLVVAIPADRVAPLVSAFPAPDYYLDELDALRVYELQRAKLDIAYINDWAARLAVSQLWQRIQDEAQPLP